MAATNLDLPGKNAERAHPPAAVAMPPTPIGNTARTRKKTPIPKRTVAHGIMDPPDGCCHRRHVAHEIICYLCGAFDVNDASFSFGFDDDFLSDVSRPTAAISSNPHRQC
mmetsp:Transcript_12948/g.37972  ORF Transcript_12948/g.37972 Transcript_12948/m.37972 type:complete len:110 (+) Transcript_12948:1626-1955(+)